MIKARQGMVAILVTAIIMIVMSLITLGFARIVQREQRQALDDQLSTQAFYAAESGVNMVAAQFAGPNTPTTAKNDCDVSAYNNGIINASDDSVRVSCLMYDPNPEELVFSNGTIRAENSKIVPIYSSPKTATLNFTWQDGSGKGNNMIQAGCNFNTPPALPTASSWTTDKKMGVLQVELMPIHAGLTSRDSLNNETFTVMLYPCSNGTTSALAYSEFIGNSYSSKRGSIVPANCTGTGQSTTCSASVDLSTHPGDFYYARLKSIYSSVNVKIIGQADDSSKVKFSNAQVVIDSTGRANDVLRRIQVRLAVSPSYNVPEAAIQAKEGGICKLVTVKSNTGSGGVEDGCQKP